MSRTRYFLVGATFLFVLDEFDELPVPLFRPGDIGNGSTT